MFNLKGKTALVTGSTQGIGFGIAKLLSEYGAKVFVHGSTSMEKCLNASKQIPNSTAVLADLSDDDCAQKLYSQTGAVDILVLNASVQYKKTWDNLDDKEIEKQFKVNIISTIKIMSKYAPDMKNKNWGRIITIGSVNQYTYHTELSVYAATKAAQAKYVRTMARTLAPYCITVNNIAPGVIETPRNDAVLNDGKTREFVLSRIPCGFTGKVDDIAPQVLLLASDEGKYINGADIVIDGGMSL